MLEDVLQELNNWFLCPDGVHLGHYQVEGGSISLPFLSPGQYFRILGSVFNDGLYQYPTLDLTDETFDGAVWALAVPRAVVQLADEIAAWEQKNGAAAAGPYTSESFGGYSYTRAAASDGRPLGWQDVFSARLSRWRKVHGAAFAAQAMPPGTAWHPPDERRLDK